MPSKQLKQMNLINPDTTQILDVLSRHAECCICMAVFHNAASCTPCLHTFCMGCIVKWNEKNNGKCPMCRVSVKDISPNYVMRDLVDSYLQVKPTMQRSEKEKEELDRSELEYIVKWLGETDRRLLYVESLASLRGPPESGDQRISVMMARAMELFKKFLGTENSFIEKEDLQKGLEKLIGEVNKEVFPATLFLKYHRLERAYKHMVRLSVPTIGPNEHTWLGNHYFDTACSEVLEISHDDDSYDESEDEFDLNLPNRIGEALLEIRHPEQRRPPRSTIGGFDPVVLEALSRVQHMRAPGFTRSQNFNALPPEILREVTTRVAQPHPLRNRRSRLRPETMEVISEHVPMLTRRHARRSEGTTENSSPPPPPPRRSARLASRTQEP